MDKIEHLEYLSKLKFSEDEKKNFEKDFDSILKFVDEIKDLELPGDLEKDEPISLSQLRSDTPKQSIDQKEVLMNAPKQKDGCYVTPLVVE